MNNLIQAVRDATAENLKLPFSVYSSVKEQRIFNVPVIKPLLICVLDGSKHLGHQGDVTCHSGGFIFLSNSPNVDMRNIPSEKEYFALLIEFEDEDFNCLDYSKSSSDPYFQGYIDSTLEVTLQQFVEWSRYAPMDIWHIRRRELLQILFYLGYGQVCGAMVSPSISHRIHALMSQDVVASWSVPKLASELAMSESTLRRKLHDEGSSIQNIKENVRLGRGLHLVQSSGSSIGHIAELCGYSSQSRFTEKFKQLFGVTPSALRRTKLPD